MKRATSSVSERHERSELMDSLLCSSFGILETIRQRVGNWIRFCYQVRVETPTLCQKQQDLRNEIMSLRRTLQANGNPGS